LSGALILGFDTSGPACLVALLEGGRCVARAHEAMERGQAERLMPMLAEMLAGAGAGFADLTAIGVGVGPGNFTGVRISVAAARGLALARAIPAIGVGRLEALAEGLVTGAAVAVTGAETGDRPAVGTPVAGLGPVAVADAVAVAEPGPRGAVFLQIFAPGMAAQAPRQIEAEDLPAALGSLAGLALAGGAANAVAAMLAARGLNAGPHLPPAMPLAEAIARIAARRRGQPQPRPSPLYLRPADAAPTPQVAPRLLDPT
jgi:tRNA threonylcarbamoyladenosine biosynthesis protein TsaB